MKRGPTINQSKALDIAHLMMTGMKRNDIAKTVGVGIDTLSEHITNMRRKTNAPSYEPLDKVAYRYVKEFGN